MMKMRALNGIGTVQALMPAGFVALCLATMLAIPLMAQEAAAPAPAAEAIPVVAVAPAPEANKQTGSPLTAEEQEARRLAAEKAASLVVEVKSLVSTGKFSDADAKCREARALYDGLGESPFVRLQLEKLKKQMSDLHVKWAMARFQQANDAYVKKDYKEAAALANNAIEINTDKVNSSKYDSALQEKLESFVEQMAKLDGSVKYVEDTKLSTVDPGNKDRKEEINVLMQEAKIFYKSKLYSQARDSLEKILIKDPYNQEAIEFLRKVYDKMFAVATKRRENEMLERVAEVEWKWNQGVLPTEKIVRPDITGPNAKNTFRSGLYEKLQKIIFPSFEFENVGINSIITHLNVRSKQLDTIDGTGVSIILQLDNKLADTLPKITMSFDNIPMSEAIRYLCQASGLNYRVEERAVIIGADVEEMDVRYLSARAKRISEITGGSSDKSKADVPGKGGLGTGKAGEGFDPTTGFGETPTGPTQDTLDTSAKLKAYFEALGVPFPPPSATIAYDRRSGKLIVRNTPENLRRLESILRATEITVPLVLIESKVLEITQTDLEELGFDWVFQDTGPMGRDSANAYTNTGAKQNPKWQVAATERVLRSVTTTNRSSATGTRSNKLINDMVVVPNFMGGDYNINLTVNAIDQSGRGETLSAPKVITSSGQPAIIRMVEQHYYPESWTEATIENANNGITYTLPNPEFGDATDLGIRLEVTPTVSPNNYTIQLQLHPEVVSFVQRTDYAFSLDIGPGVITTSTNIWMPELAHRDLTANVKVYDGETVVLGGMLRDNTEARDDKWPVLGDIPLVGRLFRSQMNYSNKRNLLIFVTARLLSNDGVPIRPEALRGVPEYNR